MGLRMRRRVVTILSALSLVLCIATLVLWYRSRSGFDTLAHWTTGGVDHQLISHGSGMTYLRLSCSDGFVPAPPTKHPSFLERLGFEYCLSQSSNIGFIRAERPIIGPRAALPDKRPALIGPGSPPAVSSYQISTEPLVVLMWQSFRAPHWFFALCLAIAPACWLLAICRRRRFAPGFCAKCGYDLRASPDRCSERGTPVDHDRL